jgi:hypothetical protein
VSKSLYAFSFGLAARIRASLSSGIAKVGYVRISSLTYPYCIPHLVLGCPRTPCYANRRLCAGLPRVFVTMGDAVSCRQTKEWRPRPELNRRPTA